MIRCGWSWPTGRGRRSWVSVPLWAVPSVLALSLLALAVAVVVWAAARSAVLLWRGPVLLARYARRGGSWPRHDPAGRVMAALALAGVMLGGVADASAATGPRWVIEQTQLARLPWPARQHVAAAAGSVVLADSPSAFLANGANAEHYTTIAPCSSLDITVNYVAKCLSLSAAPPPPGTWALYDPEGWQLTPVSEYQNQCQAMLQAAGLIAAAGATAVIAPSDPRRQWLVQCAARAAAKTGGEVMVHLQTQPWETDLPSFMHVLRQATRWVRSQEPGMTVSFGVSTNPKYSATAYRMFYAWQQATGYLGASAPCWLNIVPVKDTQIRMAARFLGLVYG